MVANLTEEVVEDVNLTEVEVVEVEEEEEEEEEGHALECHHFLQPNAGG